MAPIMGREGREKRDGREGGKIVFFIISILSIIPILSAPVLGWGSITHAAICKEAGGSESFMMGGVAPDMIALHSVTTGDASYDYAHNCYGDSREPVFGNLLSGISSDDFAAGWRAHQVADSVVHGPGGYSTSKTFFKSLPGRYGGDINHGAVELVVDAIILEEYYRGDVALFVPEESELIHAGAIAFYNGSVGGGRAIQRENIITCQAARDMAYNWQNCLQTNIFLASLLTGEPWFSSVRGDFSDYRQPYERSIGLVCGLAGKTGESPGWLLAFVDFVIPPREAEAAGSEAPPETNTYYSFLNEVSKRAREIGGGKATKESTRQAVEELSRDKSVPAEQRVWAEAMSEMTNGNNKTRGELEASVVGKLRQGRDGSANGAAGGQRISLLPYLPCAALLFLAAAAIIWQFRLRRR